MVNTKALNNLKKADWIITGIEVPILGTLGIDHFIPFLPPIVKVILTIGAGVGIGYIIISLFLKDYYQREKEIEIDLKKINKRIEEKLTLH
jgi:hypothetical protein